MRNSITYNLKYFIMKMSGTKPMKNTMRKPSPMKQTAAVGALKAGKKALDVAVVAKKTKTDTGSPRPTGTKVKAAVKEGAAMASKAAANAARTPAMQMKKSGMGKKC
jgi:hypothetical protein